MIGPVNISGYPKGAAKVIWKCYRIVSYLHRPIACKITSVQFNSIAASPHRKYIICVLLVEAIEMQK